MVIPVVKNLWEEYKIREFKFLSKRFLPPSSGVKKRLNPYSPGYKYIMGHLILYPSYEVFTTGIIIKDIHTCRLIHYAKAMCPFNHVHCLFFQCTAIRFHIPTHFSFHFLLDLLISSEFMVSFVWHLVYCKMAGKNQELYKYLKPLKSSWYWGYF